MSVEKLGVLSKCITCTNFAQYMASIAVKMHLGNKKSCKKVVIVSFLANLADLDKNHVSFSAFNLAITRSTCSCCRFCSSVERKYFFILYIFYSNENIGSNLKAHCEIAYTT